MLYYNPEKSGAWLAIRIFSTTCRRTYLHVIKTSQNDLSDRITTRVEKSLGAPLFYCQMMSVFIISMNIQLFTKELQVCDLSHEFQVKATNIVFPNYGTCFLYDVYCRAKAVKYDTYCRKLGFVTTTLLLEYVLKSLGLGPPASRVVHSGDKTLLAAAWLWHSITSMVLAMARADVWSQATSLKRFWLFFWKASRGEMTSCIATTANEAGDNVLHHQLALQWRHSERDCVSNHQPHDCLFRRRSKKTSKLRVTGLCVGNSPVTGEFFAQVTSNAENVSIWWRHRVRAMLTSL